MKFVDFPQMVTNCRAAAGFSVGEITAYVFAGALSIETGINSSNNKDY